MRLRVARIELQQPPVADQRLVVLADRPIDVGHVEHGQVVVGLERERALEGVERARELAAARVLVAQHQPGVDHLRILAR